MPLYVADALDAAEREELRRHLARGCVACAAHLAEAEATFTSIALALDPVAPPPELFQRVLDRIDRQARTTPIMASTPWNRVAFAAAAAVVLTAVTTYTVVERRDRRRIDDAQLAYNTDARALLLQTAIADRDQTVDQLRRKLVDQQQLVDALGRPDTRVIDLAGAGQPRASARLVWSPTAGRSVLLTHDLAAPPVGRTYELWYITADQKKVPATTFGVDPTGASVSVAPIPPGLAPLTVAAVTDEPIGGVPAPTGTIQLAGKAQ